MDVFIFYFEDELKKQHIDSITSVQQSNI